MTQCTCHSKHVYHSECARSIQRYAGWSRKIRIKKTFLFWSNVTNLNSVSVLKLSHSNVVAHKCWVVKTAQEAMRGVHQKRKWEGFFGCNHNGQKYCQMLPAHLSITHIPCNNLCVMNDYLETERQLGTPIKESRKVFLLEHECCIHISTVVIANFDDDGLAIVCSLSSIKWYARNSGGGVWFLVFRKIAVKNEYFGTNTTLLNVELL